MKRLNQLLAVGGMAVLLGLSCNQVMAQGGGGGGGGRGGRGNFDPAQMQQRMMDRYKEQMEITNDAEWKAIQPLVQKVADARMQAFRGGFGGRRGGGPGGDRAANPEAEALQKAIDAKASNAELKAAIAKYSDARKAKQADLEKAQNDLRKVLTVRQEALATLAGIL